MSKEIIDTVFLATLKKEVRLVVKRGNGKKDDWVYGIDVQDGKLRYSGPLHWAMANLISAHIDWDQLEVVKAVPASALETQEEQQQRYQ